MNFPPFALDTAADEIAGLVRHFMLSQSKSTSKFSAHFAALRALSLSWEKTAKTILTQRRNGAKKTEEYRHGSAAFGSEAQARRELGEVR